MLSVSLGIGFYHGCTGGKQKTTQEFLLADRSMNPIPVAMSLVASFISAITVLGTPAEVYINGAAFWLFAISYPIVAILVSRLFIPVFFRLNVTSANEVRFDLGLFFAYYAKNRLLFPLTILEKDFRSNLF